MLIVISPAKALDFSRPDESAPVSTPQLADQTMELAKVTRRLKVADLKRLMSLSDNLAKLNRERFQAFDPASEEGVQAAFAFNGDVYQGLQARTLDRKGLTWAQDHLRILSGFYGVLRPLDVIQPYRLEMGVRLTTRRGQSLYDFWGARISKQLNADAEGHKDPTVVNLASSEYFGAVDLKALKAPKLTCRFVEEKDGERRMLGFFAKKARGLMARFVIDNRIERTEDLKAFDVAGYRFEPSLAKDGEWTFSRPQPAAAVAA
ncbi:MAG: peroxide stress protein YaaA [Phenylobacterium sp.]|uniref:peroxide stress protein YaaA n=1 Tax=Phenylobacterium sp. TaxID=1871053 RepID=UPI0027357990|nr:peroxide stress protein YaaA [Phenylobacterium sp.]MDP3173503.1 peroxide stress protein YaaA [Phenylobacterium sp.]